LRLETEDKARRLLSNVSFLLKLGGYFFGITPEKKHIKKLTKSHSLSKKNYWWSMEFWRTIDTVICPSQLVGEREKKAGNRPPRGKIKNKKQTASRKTEKNF
ncbi:hypothetical protein Gotur_023069, partial [Gossypium turneri]